MKFLALLFLACLYSYLPVPAQEKPVVLNQKLMYLSTLSPVVTQEYFEAQVFDNGLITIKTRNGWKLIDYRGNEIEDSQSIQEHSFSNGVAIMNEGGLMALRHRIINEQGEVISVINASTIRPFKEEAACYKHDNQKFGVINKQGEEIIKAQYDDCDKIFVVENERYFRVKKEDKWGLIDDKNEVILPLEYSKIEHVKNDLFKYSYIDPDEPTFTNVWGTQTDNYISKIWSIKNGNITERPISDITGYSAFLTYDKHLVRFKGDTDWSVIDLEGNIVLTYPTSYIFPVSDRFLATGKKNSDDEVRYAVSDYNLKEQTPYTISRIKPIKNGFIPFCISDATRTNCGYADENLQLKIPLTYNSETWEFQDDGRAIVQNEVVNQNGKVTKLTGMINNAGEVIIPPVFTFIQKISEDYYIVSQPETFLNEELIRYKDGSPVFKKSNSIYRKYGKYYGSIGDFQNALINFQKLDALTIEDKLNMGIAYNKLGQPEQAITYLNQIAALRGSDIAVMALAERGEIYFSSENVEAGKKDFEQAISESNNNASIKLRYGIALQKAKLFDESIEQLNEVLIQYPQAWEAYEYLGVAQAEKKLISEAIGSFSKAIQFNANKINLYYFRGQAYMMNSEPLKAIVDYEQAIKMTGSSNPSGYHIRLADAYELSGNRAKACELWNFLAPHSEASKEKVAEKCE